MPAELDLQVLVDYFAEVIPTLNFDGDQLEEHSTMLLRLQNQVETGEPIEWIVEECLKHLNGVVATVHREVFQ
jgi:hypothetical protein